MKIIPCLGWVERGVAAALPTKVKIDQKDLHELIASKDPTSETSDSEADQARRAAAAVTQGLRGSAKAQMREDEENDISGDEEEATIAPGNKEQTVEERYEMENYENEDARVAGIEGIAMFASETEDPYITQHEEDEDANDEDFLIKPSDNLLVVGRVNKDEYSLEVHVYNEEEETVLYCHHDYILAEPPTCLEIIQYDPGSESKGNLCAVGSMSPGIDIWDLNLVESLEPVVSLGKVKKASGKTKRAKGAAKAEKVKDSDEILHSDAVISLAWNKHLPHILASGSADNSIILWDLDTLNGSTKLTDHEDKVQCLQWHPTEEAFLLSGDCSGVVRLWDCQYSECVADWKVDGEVERLCWEGTSEGAIEGYHFWVATSEGFVHKIDRRKPTEVLGSLKCHEEGVTGLAICPKMPNCLVTTSGDGYVKVWNAMPGETSNAILELAGSKLVKSSHLQCFAFCPDNRWLIATGALSASQRDTGELLQLTDLRKITNVAATFGESENESAPNNAAQDEGTMKKPADLPPAAKKSKRAKQNSSSSSASAEESSSSAPVGEHSAKDKGTAKRKKHP